MRVSGELRIVLLPANESPGSIIGTNSLYTSRFGSSKLHQEEVPDGQTYVRSSGETGSEANSNPRLSGTFARWTGKKLGLSDKLTRNEISKYDRGVREPALSVLLKYGRSVM